MKQLELFEDHSQDLEGLRIVIDRMDRFPEEFATRSGRWGWLIRSLETRADPPLSEIVALTTDEEQLLRRAFSNTQRKNFTSKVLNSLSKERDIPSDAEPARQHLPAASRRAGNPA